VIKRYNGAVPVGTVPHGCSRMGILSSHATYASTPDANHFAMTGPRARFASLSFSHDGWLRRAFCCDGANIRGMTSCPRVIERVTASNVPSSEAHASRACTRAVTWDCGMIGLPASSRGRAIKSGNASRPSFRRRGPSAQAARSALSLTMAATAPASRKTVVSDVRSPPLHSR
jgi:hypothetical protein